MLTNGTIDPWKAGASIFPLLYGVLLFMKLPNAGLMLTILVVVLVAIVWYAANQGLSIWTLLPAIVGIFLLLTCVGALYEGVSPTSLLPLSHTSIELWIMALLALGYVGWVAYATRQVL